MNVTRAIQALCLLILIVAMLWRKSPTANAAFTSAVLLTIGMKSTGWLMWLDFITGSVELIIMFVEIHSQHELRD